jgi:hypothetical protein
LLCTLLSNQSLSETLPLVDALLEGQQLFDGERLGLALKVSQKFRSIALLATLDGYRSSSRNDLLPVCMPEKNPGKA